MKQFSLRDGKPTVRVKGIGSCMKVDPGIVAYHFETVGGRAVAQG